MGKPKKIETTPIENFFRRNRSRHPPVPFDDSEIKDKWWEGEDPGDSSLPSKKGFISDFVYHWRTAEAPTIFGIWAALFALSSAIKREAWIPWLPDDNLYANLYLFFISPPATCKKNTVINAAIGLLERLEIGLKSETARKLKRLNIINTATGEKLDENLAKLSGRKVHLPNEETHEVGCSIIIAALELATFLGKQKYNEGKITTLLNIYDTGSTNKSGTIGRGWQTSRNHYTNLIGGTTKSGLKDSIPAAALGDGFLSRTIIVYQERGTRRRTKPQKVEGAPSKEDLIMRLGWIAENTMGPYDFSPEAEAFFDTWYNNHRDKIDALGEDGSSFYSRFDIHIRKVAFLLRAQRYSISRQIELCDIEDAIKIIEATGRTVPLIVEEICGDEATRYLVKAETYIKARGSVKRSQLMQNRKLTATQIDRAVEFLRSMGKIEIWYDGKEHERTGRKTNEIYKWIAGDVYEEV